MPTIETIDGVRIVIHNGEHRPPHIHAIYGESEVLIEIETDKICAGDLPAKQLKKAIKWLTENADLALSIYYELNPYLK